MLSPNYDLHEPIYQSLRNSGQAGWGGDSFASRMREWNTTLSNLANLFSKEKPILEIGCGAGQVSIELANRGLKTIGVDISPTAVQWAKENARAMSLSDSTQFEVANVSHKLPFEDSTFGAVVDGNCLHCIIGEHRKLALREIHRVLSIGGLFYVSTNSGPLEKLRSLPNFDEASRCQVRDGFAYRYFADTVELLSEIEDAGFRVESFQVVEREQWNHVKLFARK